MCLILIVRIRSKLNVVEGLDTNGNNPYKFKQTWSSCQRWRFWLELKKLHYIKVVSQHWKSMTSSTKESLNANAWHSMWVI